MNRAMTSLMLVAALAYGVTAVADNTSMNSSTMTSEQKQMMKDCMAKEKAKSDGTSKDEMKKTCMAQVNPQIQNGGANVAPTPASKPQ